MTTPAPSSYRHLSGAVGRLAAAGHGGAALKLIHERGGGRVYVPKKPGGKLLEIIDRAALAALIGATDGGGVEIDIPPRSVLVPGQKSAIIAAADGGAQTLEIAKKLGVSERHVRRVKNDAGCAAPPGGVKQKHRRRQDDATMDIDEFLARQPA
jgi:hypothetical protein